MLTHSARRFGLVITATFAIAACAGTKGKAIDANPVYTDAGDDVGVVAADTGPDAPVLGLDSAGPDTTIIDNDTGPDAPVLGLDSAGPDTTIIDNDAGPDAPVLGLDSASLDTTIISNDAGPDDNIAKPPNILVILVDDLGYGDLSSYGATDLKSPAIDQLAAEGMRFTDFHSNSPVCSPTRAALLTGRFPDLVGVPGVIRQEDDNTWGRLADDATLLAQPLNRTGYHTAIVGKWHLGLEPPDTPFDRGFAFFHGFLADMMDDYYTHLRTGVNWMRMGRDEVNPVGHATDIFTQWAIEYLAERKGQPEPFFLYLAYNAPHIPIQPPPEWLQRVLDREPGISAKRASLVALIEHLDNGIGKVMQALEDNGQRENTLVIFASDNGGQLDVGANNGPLRGGKGQMWEGGVRVPAVASWSGHIEARTTTSAVFMTMDIFATVLEAAGIDYAGEVEAQSFLPVLLGKTTAAAPRDLFFVRREYPGGVYYGARNGDYKLVQNTPDEPFTLYNLRDDLAETTDLSGSEPAKFLQLTGALERHRLVAEKVPWQ